MAGDRTGRGPRRRAGHRRAGRAFPARRPTAPRRWPSETSLVADANRLAALSGTAESLDLTYLLAAQGFRLRDTPETRDALLASLVEHRRVIRTETMRRGTPRFPRRRRPDGLRRQPPHRPDPQLARRLGGPAAPRPRGGRELGGLAGHRRVADRRRGCSPPAPASPGRGSARSTPTVPSARCSAVRRWAGSRSARWSCPTVGAPGCSSARHGSTQTATWRLVEVDLVDGTRREIGVQGTAPGALSDLKAVLSDDGTHRRAGRRAEQVRRVRRRWTPVGRSRSRPRRTTRRRSSSSARFPPERPSSAATAP